VDAIFKWSARYVFQKEVIALGNLRCGKLK